MVEWWTRKDDNKIVVASVKERENNITLLVWREDDQKIVGRWRWRRREDNITMEV